MATTKSFTLDGITARSVGVEVDVHRGLPSFSIVGLPDAAVREARERVRAAIVNSGFEFPQRRITVNLAPASLRKAGPGLDLAIAAALLSASGQVESSGIDGSWLAGELALDGRIRAVPGALAMAEAARAARARAVVVPLANAAEASLAPELEVFGVAALAELREVAAGERSPGGFEPLALSGNGALEVPDLADLRGQSHLRRALEVAAAGGHNLLMIGPPGVGKSLAARRLPSILPPLSRTEALEVARINSACGRLDPSRLSVRPFRAPHHSISAPGLIGGGMPPRPGEVTLAHRGVLFLDELCEFRRDALEGLRSPLEEGRVSISRTGGRVELPCEFVLVAASNPCPCGRGEQSPDCTCPAAAVQRYSAKLSGALADRIEIVVPLSRPAAGEMSSPAGECSAEVRARTTSARAIQTERLGEGCCNAKMTAAQARRQPLTDEARGMLEHACEREGLSGRAHDRILRLARTVADLEGHEGVEAEDVAAALALRRRGDG